ncbi:hypothetical protein CNEO_40662 [Clostridium neonatale]|uniref:TnsA endonuclease N-terminal domain-containing protein n=1 Tax=Clostridium neonatale TaxID=137838 RepID=A0AA86MQY5_9CLOT|nr:hypothetical protein CNEO_40662 [Clostridium neonatale]
MRDGTILCRTIKQCNDLTKRQIDKFEIERRYWDKKGISWKVVTERNIDKVMANNIELVYQFYDLQTIKGFEKLNIEQIKELVLDFKKYILGKSIIREKASDFEEQMLLESGCGISIFKHLVITKQVYIDMLIPISIDKEILILEREE